jgi:hypothetical protein
MKTLLTVRTLGATAALAAAGVIAACSDSMSTSTSAANGTMAVQLTDAPFLIDSVSSVDVFVVRVDARLPDADSAAADKAVTDDSVSAGGWTTLAMPNQKVNLLAYQNGAVLPLGEASLAAGSYLGFRLIIDPTKSSVTLKNGMVLTGTSTPNITFPSASRTGIKVVLTQPVTVVAAQTTTVLVDFMVANSFVLRGNSITQNGLLFTPVVRASVK